MFFFLIKKVKLQYVKIRLIKMWSKFSGSLCWRSQIHIEDKRSIENAGN